ncbi:hypothetical protein NQ315_005539 [Exocentrus adspersus]|uniref:Uncharacterized protein n=1 Tax=Exocentrus adspersus TaxID=1586481 RepID=A0AAV8VTM9_9CUCU|nr:hypothetical protein NQ315_005539 [Exocentrus adspersus]
MEMEIISYEKICRICLKESDYLESLFTLKFTTDETFAVDFMRKITDLKMVEANTLPSNICSQCVKDVNAAFDLTQLCIASETALRNQETRRMLREIEEEALSEEEIVIKCEDGINQENLDAHQSPCEVSHGSGDNLSDNDSVQEDLHFTTVKLKDKYKCEVCALSFNNKTKFNQHKKTHDKSKPFKCEECLQTFSKKLHLNVHLRSHIKQEDKKFSCEMCGKQFIFEYLLKQHEYKHKEEKPFPCTKCDKGCLTAESVLKIHMRKHTNERPYICDICGTAFRRSTDLKSHNRTHTGEKPVLCTICGKKMSTTGQLTIHLRTHTGEKPFSCPVCSRAFVTKTILVKHQRIHTGERPYICDICGRAFNQSSTLRTHIKIHRPNANNKKKKRTRNQQREESKNLCLEDGTVVVFKNGIQVSENSGRQYVVNDLVEISEEQCESIKTEYTVILPAPIPLLQNM